MNGKQEIHKHGKQQKAHHQQSDQHNHCRSGKLAPQFYRISPSSNKTKIQICFSRKRTKQNVVINSHF